MVTTDEAIDIAKVWLLKRANLLSAFITLDSVETKNGTITVDFYYSAFYRPGVYRVGVNVNNGQVSSFKRISEELRK